MAKNTVSCLGNITMKSYIAWWHCVINNEQTGSLLIEVYPCVLAFDYNKTYYLVLLRRAYKSRLRQPLYILCKLLQFIIMNFYF